MQLYMIFEILGNYIFDKQQLFNKILYFSQNFFIQLFSFKSGLKEVYFVN